MPLWLTIAIGTSLLIWNVVAIASLHDDRLKTKRYRLLLGRDPVITYTPAGKFLIVMWIPADLFYLSYLIFA